MAKLSSLHKLNVPEVVPADGHRQIDSESSAIKPNLIVIRLFQLIWHQAEFHLVLRLKIRKM